MNRLKPIKLVIFRFLVVFITIAGLLSPSFSGEIYKWRDKDGVLHYSDVPPPTLESETATPPGEEKATPAKVAADAQHPRYTKGNLWKVEKSGSVVCYILGTIHSEDERVLNIPAAVEAALARSNSFTMEVIMDKNALGKVAVATIYLDGSSLKTVLGDELFGQVAEALAPYGVPPVALNKMKPWAVLAALSAPKPETGQFLDLVLLNKAKKQGKQIYGLESVEEQVAVFADMPIDDQIHMIREALEYLPELPQQIEAMIKKYLAQDLHGILTQAEMSMKEGNQRISADLYRRLNTERNLRMVERMQPRLKEGKAFIAIGALHLPGPDGVLHLLEQQGYKVRAVP